MADEIRGVSANCLNNYHAVCVYHNCDCQCHRGLTVAERIEALSRSHLPDNERLQVLIQLTAQLAQELRK